MRSVKGILDIFWTVMGNVSAEDGKSGDDRGRAFGVTVLYHNVTKHLSRIQLLQPVWSTDKLIASEATVRILK